MKISDQKTSEATVIKVRVAMACRTPKPRCYKCRIGFLDFEDRTAHRRYIEDMAVRHPYQCKECELSFISVPHVKFHTKTIHDTPCDICGLLFEFKCIETGVEMMKFSDVIQNQTEYIDILEKDLMLEVIRKGVSNIELKKKLQGAVMKLDRGANDISTRLGCT